MPARSESGECSLSSLNLRLNPGKIVRKFRGVSREFGAKKLQNFLKLESTECLKRPLIFVGNLAFNLRNDETLGGVLN